MKEQDSGSMEQDIVNEESTNSFDLPQKTPKVQLPKIQLSKESLSKISLKTAFTFSKTKILAIITVLILILVTLITVVILGSKKPNNIVLDPEIQIASPQPKNTPNPEFLKIEQEIDKFKNKVDLITNQDVDLPPPEVDLNIAF